MGIRSGAQAGRWVAMLDRLAAARGGLTVGELAAEFNCTPRTIYRDLAALQERLGAPLVTDRDDGADATRWRLIDGSRVRANLDVTPSELLAVMAAARMMAPLAATPYAAGLTSLLAKLRSRVAETAARTAEADAEALVAGDAGRRDLGKFASMIETLRIAMRERRTVEMTYASLSPRGEAVRRIDPLRLWWAEGTLYVVGACHVHGGRARTFAIERIRKLRATDEHFVVPASFDWDDYVRDSFRVFRGEPARVVVHFSAEIAPRIRERIWHPSQRLFELPGGEVGLALRVAGTAEITGWILGFGSDARVIEPDSIARTIRAHAAAIHTRSGSHRAPTARAARQSRGRT